MADLFDFNYDPLRHGQYKGLGVIFERAVNRSPYTGIVKPTRYGKSDMMRIAAVQLWKHKIVSTTFALSPGCPLRDQLGDKKKWEECVDRYKLLRSAAYRTLAYFEDNPIANRECFLSMTMQLGHCNVKKFVDLAQRMIDTTGLPPHFFIDECHLTSDENKWGEFAYKLAEAKALVTLMTAYEYRENGRPPQGFDFDEQIVNTEARRIHPARGSTPDVVKIITREGVEKIVTVTAHDKTSFAEAWQEPNSPLCKVDRVPFDVKLSEAGVTPDEEPDNHSVIARISTMSANQTRKYLGTICRSAIVIYEGARRLVELLKEKKLTDPTLAAIVFCDVDREDNNGELEVNRYAKKIAKAIASISGGERFLVLIATSATEDDNSSGSKEANSTIRKFAPDNGIGDVLIVKQMGGAGLDCGRIKIVLDLSPIRAASSWIQRVMRGATPYKEQKVFSLITPDDCISKQLFDDLVASQGGEAAKIFEGEIVSEYEVPREEQEWLDVVGTEDADFNDNQGNVGEADQYIDVRAIVQAFPIITSTMTSAQIAVASQSLVDKLRNGNERVADIQSDINICKSSINNKAHEITMEIIGVYDPVNYGETIPGVWVEAYKMVGLNPKTNLKDITDLKVLRRVEQVLIRILKSKRQPA